MESKETSDVRIRAERPRDRTAIHAVNVAAFETPTEAKIVRQLRDESETVISLVAEDVCAVVGHIMFSPVQLLGYEELKIMGLAPMAVEPALQGKGIGLALVKAGLGECKKLGYGAVVVVGHPEYYPRFGFEPGARFGIACEFDVPSEAFMVMEIEPGYLEDARGTIQFHRAFSEA